MKWLDRISKRKQKTCVKCQATIDKDSDYGVIYVQTSDKVLDFNVCEACANELDMEVVSPDE